MQLKKLQLIGFKTFADKTEIQIDSGLTAIVGPNGSGKSNIVDALLWVLGEQNPRFLRGASAQDVIFNGTDRRKALGMAEVRLTIDNSDGTLPINFIEVTITRRIYRSGESQYLINGTICRLKDVIELFLDTGVGKGAYAFVSQQEIDAVLSAKPEDRRELFEEAAGIKKYRVKKREALRKLESAEVNLYRIRDILHELEVQREPMEKQAQTAKRYLHLQDRLHQIEVGLLVSELQKADYELYAVRTEKEMDQETLHILEAEMAACEREARDAAERLELADIELEDARVASQTAQLLVERTENQLALFTERSQSAERSEAHLAEEILHIEERMNRLKDEMEFDRSDLEETEKEEETKKQQWAGKRAALDALETAVAHALQQAQDRQDERMRLTSERASLEAGLLAARDRLSDAILRESKLVKELEELQIAAMEIKGRVDLAWNLLEVKTNQRKHFVMERERIDKAILEVHNQQSVSRSSLETSRRIMAEQSSRLSTLSELQESHEGFYQGVRAVLNAEKKGQIKGHYRAVVDLLEVPEPYRVAIEVALGGSLQDIVTLTEAEAKSGINWLKQNRAGRATFLALPLLKPGYQIKLDHEMVAQSALELITFDPQYEKMAHLLLGRVLVVENMEEAISVSRRLTGWSKIVTLEGELLSPGGALTGGSLQGKGAHLVGRKGEMDDLRAKLPKSKSEVERLSTLLEQSTTYLRTLDAERTEITSRASTVQAELAASESSRISAEREYNRIEQDLQSRENSLIVLTTQRDAFEKDVERLTKELFSGEVENLQSDDALILLQEETRTLTDRRDICRSESVSLEVEVSRLKQKCEGLTRTISSNKAALVSLESQYMQKGAQQESAALNGQDALQEHERLHFQMEEAQRAFTGMNRNLEHWKERRAKENTYCMEANATLRNAIQSRSDITQSLHKSEMAQARLELQLVQASARLMDEYGISKDEAMARPDDTSIDKNTAIEVGRLRREIRAMGQVNTGAVEEYDRLTERFKFLDAQQTDLNRGKESLLATIAEIDDSTRGVFMETFEAVRIEFEKLFTRLFEGGSTKLILTNENDLLETGIEVIAQPPGKKAQHLSLLSGGERALTATALLFAFLAVRPSPFVLLDEVDAPLDGANVEKFTSLVKEFSARSQFLIITHNPTTMEAAPIWYGITMREPGISSILSYRVPQESSEAVVSDEALVLSR